MSAPHILVVEDEPHVRKLLRLSLQAEGYGVDEAATAETAVAFVQTGGVDLMILDLGLPDIDGQQVIRDVRLRSTLPILVLSGRTEDREKIAALEHGADDYVQKPFVMPELVARVRAALDQHFTRNKIKDASSISTGELQIPLDRREVFRGDHPVPLEEEEYAILRLLALHGGRVITHGRLMKALWGKEGGAAGQRQLQKHIGSLRRKLEAEPAFPRYIVTEPGVGYRLELLPVKSA